MGLKVLYLFISEQSCILCARTLQSQRYFALGVTAVPICLVLLFFAYVDVCVYRE